MLQRSTFESDMDEEFRLHIELHTADLIRSGLKAREAARRARLEFGAMESYKEQGRESRGLGQFHELQRDARYAVRALRRSPGFASVAIFTLALGIGGMTAIFTVVRGVVVAPLPYPDASRLVRFKSLVPGIDGEASWDLSTAQYFYYRDNADAIEEIGAFRRAGVNVRGSGEPKRVSGAIVTASMMRLLGARPALGRVIDGEDDATGAPVVVALSHEFWRREFGGDPSVVGRTLELNERAAEVIGVMAPRIRLPGEAGAPGTLQQPDLWVPYRLDPSGPFFDSHSVSVIGRLVDGLDINRAREEIERLTTRLPEAFPTVYDPGFMQRYDFRGELLPLKEYEIGDMAQSLWILFGAVGLVLLIAAANVTNLFLVRMEGRRRELAVRSALGAGRAAITRHLLVE
ncbi:MAG TPA: ABC transporter permease, partial [Longimicrobiaceae bacterium]|nr:ABC transporter permease [Longimicrobiaceae bacterium]